MIMTAHTWMYWCGIAAAASAAAYTFAAAMGVRVKLRTDYSVRRGEAPAVTILKPLCGDEHELYEGLRSFCEQDYPRFQIVFGVADGADPAADAVSRLQREFPKLDLKLVVDRRQHGSSRKVSNLMNMMPLAQHDFLVISDSDVR